MKKLLFFIIILSITVFISYKYSYRVYIEYLKIYYNNMYTEQKLSDKAQYMYDNKMYEELEGLIYYLLIIYPNNDEFKRIGALNYTKLGDVLKSAEVLTRIDDVSAKNTPVFEEILKNLYDNEYYSDVLSFYSRKIMLDSANISFYYGVSLYKKDRYDESYTMLMNAKNKKLALSDLDFYIGLNLEKKGDKPGAIKHVKAAFDSDMSNAGYRKKLADLYRQNNMFKEAAIILRM